MKFLRIKIILFFQYPLLIDWVSEWVSEWLLFNANSAIFQLYYDENDDEVRFILDQHAELDSYSASSLK